ncbi:disease resistance protein SUMM2 isoform X2 [Citrus clementina]|uniref:disease resistance protein SUMM2 isoform X2 n=1 Tax=Citrus clementina TaxID=85681 RepID=UPI000CED2CB6|nr:disease resistance protein SUMM2 isoform X2 [Citrus x clementina]
MGNILQISIDGAIFSRCLDCFLGKAAYIRNLQDNVVALETELGKLIEAKNDVMARVVNAERQPMMTRLNKVQGWLSRVDAVKAEADELIRHGSQEIEKLCLGGYCSKNCHSSYKFGKKVTKKLRYVGTLMAEGAFEVVAERAPESVADERPIEPTVVGLQSQLEQVWRCIQEESVGIVGLYGMGGVGKTTLLTQINNKFLESPTNFNYVIWVVVSKDLRLENLQETIGEKIGLLNGGWKNRRIEQKALDIFRILKGKKFVLLLDDLWQRVDLTKVGVPLPGPQNNASKVVFTTRSEEVCGLMEAHKKFKVACLSDIDAWELFRQKVGEEALHSHPDIVELAHTVAKECGGLPLALITTGRAMACKKTPEEWTYAIEVLSTSSSQFPERDRFGEQNQGYHILGILLHACVLEEGGDGEVKMHDVIRDMALWIACDIEKEKENFLVYAGFGFIEAPPVRGWKRARRLSLMHTRITNLSNIPTCPHLLTLFLNKSNLSMIHDDFFQFMPSLKVLNLSYSKLTDLPVGISKLASLQLLDLSELNISELPEELKALVNLKCLNLEWTRYLISIPRQLISNLSRLHVLRMFGASHNAFDKASEDSILFGGGELVVEELLGLKYLEVTSFNLRSSPALQSFLSSHKLRCCTQALLLQHFKDSTFLEVSALADLKKLNRLWIRECEKLEQLKMDYTEEVQPFVFHSLKNVGICGCYKLKDLTFLVFAPNLESIEVTSCRDMEEIVSMGKFAEVPEVMANLNPFAKLQNLELTGVINLKSIYWKPLPFPHLKSMSFLNCHKLKKLPLDSNSARERNIVIYGDGRWWEQLEWVDEATRNAFLPCFKS